MSTTTVASKSAATPGAALAPSRIGAFVRRLWSATPAAILIAAMVVNRRGRR